MLGLEADEFPGRFTTWLDLIHLEDRQHALADNQDCIDGKTESFATEFRMRHKNGTWRWILGRGKSVARDPQGKALRLVGTHTDMTEHKNIEQGLKETEERLLLAQNSAKVGIWDRDLLSGKLTWTEELERIYGYEVGTFPGTYKAFSERVHPDDLAKFEHTRDWAVNESKRFDFDFRKLLPSGETRWVNCKGAAHCDDSGNPYQLLGVNVDITERKRTEEALQRAHDELELRVRERTAELAKASEAVVAERQRLYGILETMPKMVCLLTPN